MLIRSLNNEEYKLQLGKYVNKPNTNPSQLHIRIRNFLKEIFPASIILEEVYIPSEKLYLDFLIPTLMICCEGMGSQHSVYTSFFHQHKSNFYKSKARDSIKKEFCELNNIKLIYFYEDESNDDWKEKIC